VKKMDEKKSETEIDADWEEEEETDADWEEEEE
jgi:hypothetical protein